MGTSMIARLERPHGIDPCLSQFFLVGRTTPAFAHQSNRLERERDGTFRKTRTIK
jgi:hypothetical protein